MTKKSIYLNHIRRLQADKVVLTDMLIQERRWRVQAYLHYRKRLRSRLWSMLDLLLLTAENKTK